LGEITPTSIITTSATTKIVSIGYSAKALNGMTTPLRASPVAARLDSCGSFDSRNHRRTRRRRPL
jgi:hypothetical protein